MIKNWLAATGLSLGMGAIALVAASPAQASPTDIQGHWARQCIEHLHRQQVMPAFPDGTFRPSLPLTRTEFAKILTRAFPESPFIRDYQDDTYVDVSDGHWAIMPIRYTYQTNFLSGFPQRTFAPQDNIPRIHVVVAIASGLNHYFPVRNADQVLSETFQDAGSIPFYARNLIAAAVEQNLIISFPIVRQFNGNQVANRGEIAAFICQATSSRGIVPLNYVVGAGVQQPPAFQPLPYDPLF